MDDCLPDVLPLPCDDEEHWTKVRVLAADPPINSLEELQHRISAYLGNLQVFGMEEALTIQGAGRNFYSTTLPYIIRQALRLPELRQELPNGELCILRQRKRNGFQLSRELVASLLANMFLCTFDQGFDQLGGGEGQSVMPYPGFAGLFQSDAPQEVAKTRMFLNYFERLANEGVKGFMFFDRVVNVALEKEEWHSSKLPLLPMEMAAARVGFETAPELAHADFANMYIGGGVLSGGCVQEEIRFSICPELCAAMLFCPVMLEDEAIQIVGGEQFSAYNGYAFNLSYGGNHKDPALRAEDGTVWVSILAMDALDLRGCDSSLQAQMEDRNLLRDLNKSLAAFTPVNDDSLRRFGKVATGNWGCGAFQGCAALKALVQWASASQCGRTLRYFPFELEALGLELARFTKELVDQRVDVGTLLQAVWAVGADLHQRTSPTDRARCSARDGGVSVLAEVASKVRKSRKASDGQAAESKGAVDAGNDGGPAADAAEAGGKKEKKKKRLPC